MRYRPETWTLENVVDVINNSNMLLGGSRPKRIRSEWQPPQYTSLRGWYFINYGLIVLFGILVIAVAYLLNGLIS